MFRLSRKLGECKPLPATEREIGLVLLEVPIVQAGVVEIAVVAVVVGLIVQAGMVGVPLWLRLPRSRGDIEFQNKT